MSWQRAHRLWNAAGLQLPRHRPQKRVVRSRPRPLQPFAPNSVWIYDFVFDGCANGPQRKCLTIVDEFTRECLAIDVAGSIRSNLVNEVLNRLISERGAPAILPSNNGPEFISKAILQWIVDQNIQTALIDPGKPLGRMGSTRASTAIPDECLGVERFRSHLRRSSRLGAGITPRSPYSSLEYHTRSSCDVAAISRFYHPKFPWQVKRLNGSIGPTTGAYSNPSATRLRWSSRHRTILSRMLLEQPNP
ncbi:MAG: DDE-type integrase/transposase/recombinase [Betaproteobacteria bacterium]|nr:DDE-type integrase/transposase/recombinase [Betaproteobacteria bacterium]